jgi:hypothetical protein
VIVAAAGSAMAQGPPPEPIKLVLAPTAAPVPALKHRLLPELAELTPGNAALVYYLAFSPEWWSTLNQRELYQKVENASRAPVADLKNSDARWLREWRPLREVDRAARREYCDWEMARRMREDGIYTQMPDVQALRQFGMLLAARARLEMAEGRLDKALYTIRTGLGLARHAGESATFIQSLVGSAIANLMLTQLEELLRQPGAPNLYWALTELPRPFVDLHKPSQGERAWLVASWPELRELDNPHLSPRQSEQLQAIAAGFIWDKFQRDWVPDAGTRVALAGRVAQAYPEARKELLAAGRKPDEVEALPALQVVLIAALREYDRLGDDLFKWLALPYPEARPGLERAEKAITEVGARSRGIPIAQMMLPAAVKVYTNTTRLDRRIAALRCVEALRLYAAAHDGQLPASLADVTEVPIPGDPMTGKALEYKVSGDTATITAGPCPGEPAVANNVLIYEVTLRR